MSIQAGTTFVNAGEIIHCASCDRTYRTSQDGVLPPCSYCGYSYYEYGEGKNA